MNILLLGGTGAMGVPLAMLMAKRNHNVCITTRKKRIDYGRIHFIEGDAHNEEFFLQVVKRKWDVVVDFMIYSTKEFQLRYKIIKNFVGQYVYISSARVYADCNDFLTEDSSRLIDISDDKEYLSTSEYALAKGRQENILFDGSMDYFTIVRPYITYNDERLQLGAMEKEDWLYRAVHGRSIVFSKDIMNRITTMTWGEDVAYGIASLLGEESTYRQAFNITSPYPITWEKVLCIYENALSQIGFTKQAVIIDRALELDGSKKYQVKYDRLFNRKFDNSKIKRYLGDYSFTPPEVGLRSCLLRFVLSGNFRFCSWYEEARRDRIAKEWTDLNEIKGVKNKFVYLKYRIL